MSFLRTILVAILRGYQILLSPILALLFGPMGHGCRFEPTCSQYTIDALSEHGCLKGFWLTLRRVARCHPWGGCGSDPVPKGHHADCPHADSVAVRSTT